MYARLPWFSVTEKPLNDLVKPWKAKKLISTNETSRTSPVWRRNQRAVTQLSLVVVSYLIGYLPHIVYFQYTSHNVSDPAKQRTDYWVLVYITILSFYRRRTR